ncbi:MAG: nucleoside triphosphate pyrophosphohydrolase [Candidatus Delongbacteria bacterium]
MLSDEELDARLSPAQVEEAEGDGRALARLLKILKVLRSPEGCPWDREQTPESLRPYLLEECHEVLAAIDSGSAEELCEELGDLCLHVAFQAELAEESGSFRLSDSLTQISQKLLRRHPHVFGEAAAADAREVERLWERVKAQEQNSSGARRDSILDGLPVALPGLLRAQRIQEKVAGVGFEWPAAAGALQKLEEEYGEFRQALASGALRDAEAEFGDFLFSVVNVARYLGVQPEDALRRTNDKFIRRFRDVERRLRAAGGDIAQTDLATLDTLWEAVKADERRTTDEGRAR